MYRPYTYLIGWSTLNLWYYGVEFKNSSKGVANPTNLWTTYFTSSKTVQDIRLRYGEPNVVEVRKVFETREQAISWERKVLSRMNVLKDTRWVNSNVGGAVSLSTSARKIIAEKNRGRVKHSAEERARRSLATRERNLARGPLSEETKAKIAAARRGKPGPANRSGRGNPMFGRRKQPDGTWIKEN